MEITINIPFFDKSVTLEVKPDHTIASIIEIVSAGLELEKHSLSLLRHGVELRLTDNIGKAGIVNGDELMLIKKADNNRIIKRKSDAGSISRSQLTGEFNPIRFIVGILLMLVNFIPQVSFGYTLSKYGMPHYGSILTAFVPYFMMMLGAIILLLSSKKSGFLKLKIEKRATILWTGSAVLLFILVMTIFFMRTRERALDIDDIAFILYAFLYLAAILLLLSFHKNYRPLNLPRFEGGCFAILHMIGAMILAAFMITTTPILAGFMGSMSFLLLVVVMLILLFGYVKQS